MLSYYGINLAELTKGSVHIIYRTALHLKGQDSSVGIATRYELDGPGPNPGGGEIFRTRPD